MESSRPSIDSDMIPKMEYVVFIAIPFDGATEILYEKIANKLEAEFKGRFVFNFGLKKAIGETPKFKSHEIFKTQNADLLEQFFLRIESADVVIADLSHNNPNVHVELGIALSKNKNILRTSGRNLTEVASDIKGTEVCVYGCENDLEKLVREYLNQFLEIKGLSIEKQRGPLHRAFFGSKWETVLHNFSVPIDFKMRDGALRVKFRFKNECEPEDWFGVYFRAGSANPWTGGYLLYIRKNGRLELAELPTVEILKEEEYPPLDSSREYTLCFGVDGNALVATLDNNFSSFLYTEKMNIQSYGSVMLGCFGSAEIEFSVVETVCRDTIAFR